MENNPPSMSESIKIEIPEGYKASKINIQLECNTYNGSENEIIKNNKIIKCINDNIETNNSISFNENLNTTNLNASYLFNMINQVKEEESMKLGKVKKINRAQAQFLSVSFITIVLSLIGFIIFLISKSCIINPVFFIVTLFMGIGWGATAIASMMLNKHV